MSINFEPYPLLLQPIYKENLWGGSTLRNLYQRHGTPELCAESWEISTHPAGASVIINGTLAGTGLAELARCHSDSLIGTAAPQAGVFPLLFKVIDAHEQLSVQVHPDVATAQRHGGDAKNEAWVVLGCSPDAKLLAGFKNGANEAILRQALSADKVGTLLNELPIQRGDALFIPGGCVHAIGAGCLLYEVQQNSNTTYRLFDWARVDTNGRTRQLHIDEALAVINWELPLPRLRHAATSERVGGCQEEVVSTAYFQISRLALERAKRFTGNSATFTAIFVENGRVEVVGGGCCVSLQPGTSCLIPAALTEFSLEPDGSAELLITNLPYD